ncbi:MAG: hypothetical protein PWP14_1587 [Methanolobus sp.]|nr:hypothetical protein [Methanolobus sp.]
MGNKPASNIDPSLRAGVNENFIVLARKLHAENPEILNHWNKSTDILEKALALAISDVVGGQA